MIHVYVDAEFDAVKIKGKFQQAIISIGAVMLNQDGNVLDTFYALVQPMHFVKLNSIVCKMTHLTYAQIKKADTLVKVLADFKQWLFAYEPDVDGIRFYSFGPDDKRTLLDNCRYYGIEGSMFQTMHNLQKEISAKVLFQDKIISPTLSLDDLKHVYQIAGNVEHNALNDAMDLMEIHKAFCLQKEQDTTQIAEIVNRKEAKRQEVLKRQQQKMIRNIRERFHTMQGISHISFHPQVIEQLCILREREACIEERFCKDVMVWNQKPYAYHDVVLSIKIMLNQEHPYIVLVFQIQTIEIKHKLLLTYKNATIIENIMKHQKGC